MINVEKLYYALFFDDWKSRISDQETKKIRKAISNLLEREKIVIENRFALINPLTLNETGKLIWARNLKRNYVSRERVRQIEANAIRKLRNFLCQDQQTKI